MEIDWISVLGSKLTCFRVDRIALASVWRSKLTWFFVRGVEIDLVFIWGSVDLVFVWVVEIDMVFVSGHGN